MASGVIIAVLIVLVIVAIGCLAWYAHDEKVAARRRDPLRETMRRLWTDHVVRTYHFIVSALGNLPDTPAVAAHLQENQDQIAAAVGKYYGQAAASQLAKLLHEHIDIAARLVMARKDSLPADALGRAWYKNADEISAFLSKANPYWQYPAMRDMMHSHLDVTSSLLEARLSHDWVQAELLHDRVIDQALHMADALTDGIEAHHR